MKKLYFVRHGLSEMNLAGLRSGVTDTPLAPEGVAQAHQAGASAAGLKVDLILSSPLQRAHHTAKIIAEQIGYPVEEIILENLLIERDFGELEGSIYSADQVLSEELGVESIEAITGRTKLLLERLQTLPHENILVVSHSSLGRALRSHVDPAHPFQASSTPTDSIPNATIIELL